MFFPERIRGIEPGAKVLEIGPGGSGHARADVYLELYIEDAQIAEQQRGGQGPLHTDKLVVYYDGGRFPFSDRQFDYVICSHVIEHVENVEYFVGEMCRVASKGYLEYPRIYYEYIYNFAVHLNLLRYKDGTLFYMKKRETPLSEFSDIHEFFRVSLDAGYADLIDHLKEIMFEGFEWRESISIARANSMRELILEEYVISRRVQGKGVRSEKTMGAFVTAIRNILGSVG